MTIRQLSLNDFRNLQSTTLDFDQHYNLIYGHNASGKTSLLEAIHIISQGRSFKTNKLNECISHETKGFLLFAKFDNYKAGISRDNNETRIRLNGETVKRLSQLTELTPIKIINPDSNLLVTGTPSIKREFIDWCLFHVEPHYHQLWLLFSHALKQRNALLRNHKSLDQIDYWDRYLSQYSTDIFNLRKKYINHIFDILNTEVFETISDLEIKLEYIPGWNTALTLQENYKKNRSKDIKYGYTQFGVHRDNINIKSNSHPVKNVLSRGQQKRLAVCLILSQVILVKKMTGKSVILLLDDIQSELDDKSIQLVLKKLSNSSVQLFVTSIKCDKTLLSYHQDYKMFHVEHGMIRSAKKP